MDYKSKLNEYCLNNALPYPKYTLVCQEGPVHYPLFTMKCTLLEWEYNGEGTSKKVAEQKSASGILENIGVISCDVVESEVESEKNTKTMVLVDADNVHSASKWIIENRPLWNARVFGSQGSYVEESTYSVKYSNSSLPDATDIQIILFASKYIEVAEIDEKIFIISGDNIFSTLEAELMDDRLKHVRTISELMEYP